jgi:hypothetical protein
MNRTHETLGTEMPDAGSPAIFFAARAQEITEFCVRRGDKLWPVPTLFTYVFFHLADRTLFMVRRGGSIAAVLSAWAMPASEIERLEREGKSQWQWRKSQDNADGLFIGEVIGTRALLPALVKRAMLRWPDWPKKRIFTHRGGKLHELKPDVIRRLLSTERPS